MQALSGAPTNFENYLKGIKLLNTYTGATFIKNNTLTAMGTGIEVAGNCIGTSIKCNLIYSTSNVLFPRGIFFDNATITDQGKASSPSNNSFINFSSSISAFKISGTLNVANPIKWFASATCPITPFSVNPISNFLTPAAVIPPTDYCGLPQIITSLDELRNHVHQVVYNELTYDTDQEENHYLDMVYAYRYLLSDSDYLNADFENLQFIQAHNDDNIGNYVAAEALRDNDQISEALARLNSLVNLNNIENNIVITERIALQCEYESRCLNDSEIIILDQIADQNVFIAGEGVINARAMLDKEVYGEPSVLRKRNTILANSASTTSWTEIESKYDINQIRVQVFDPIGRELFNGSYANWKAFKLKGSILFVTVRYHFDQQFIGQEKQVLLK